MKSLLDSSGDQEKLNFQKQEKRLEEIRTKVRTRLEQAREKLARRYNL